MFVVENRVSRLGALVRLFGQLFKVLTSGRVARVMMMIAVGLCNWIMRAGLIILKLVGMILSKCRIEVLFLVGSGARVSGCSVVRSINYLLLAHKALYEDLLLLAVPQCA